MEEFFLVLLLAIIYSYFIYSRLFGLFNDVSLETNSSYPKRKIVFLIAAYNEEIFLEQTILSILDQRETIDIEKIYFGDDGSYDNTWNILQNFEEQYPDLFEILQYDRIGKGNILNDIVSRYNLGNEDYSIVSMDANIALDNGAIEKLIKKLRYKNVGMVGASVYPFHHQDNIESRYILKENYIKNEESRAFGWVIGVFGVCYIIQGEQFTHIPSNFVTDDLYLTFASIERFSHVLYSDEAIVRESIQAEVMDEFKRKKRYAAGNFQILFRFWKLLLPSFRRRGFIYSYFFHKVIRWISPVLMFFIWIYSLIMRNGDFELFIALSGIVVCLFLLLNVVLNKKKKLIIGKRLFYFLMMNLAILLGFFDFLKGIKTNTWERSERTK